MSKSKIFDLQTFTHYACEHTASECANYFEAKISNTIAYAKYHNIKFKSREYKGEKHTIAEWARLYSLSYSALFHRLSIGWSLVKALNTKVGYRCQK